MRQRFCRMCRGWHELDKWPVECWEHQASLNHARSSLPSPMVISDNIDPVRSMADGKEYTSKAALRATYKPSGNPQGNSYAEVGNEIMPSAPKPKPDDGAIQASLQKAVARYERGERV